MRAYLWDVRVRVLYGSVLTGTVARKNTIFKLINAKQLFQEESSSIDATEKL